MSCEKFCTADSYNPYSFGHGTSSIIPWLDLFFMSEAANFVCHIVYGMCHLPFVLTYRIRKNFSGYSEANERTQIYYQIKEKWKVMTWFKNVIKSSVICQSNVNAIIIIIFLYFLFPFPFGVWRIYIRNAHSTFNSNGNH